MNMLESSLEDPADGSTHDGRKWEWSYLRKKCRNMELEEYYQVYKQRLCISYLSLFTLLQIPIMGVHCIILLASSSDFGYIVPDILAYMITTIVIWIIMYANLREEFLKKHQYVVYVTSWSAISLLVLMDIGITLYHATESRDILRPSYSAYTIYAVYLFMPLPNYVHPFILGMAVTVAYLINYGLVTLKRRSNGVIDLDVARLITEALFLLCCNLLGIFFRMMQEIAIRTTFLDRRQYVEENLLLRFYRDQEKSLLLSIIPGRIADRIEQDVKARIERRRTHTHRNSPRQVEEKSSMELAKRWRQPDSEKLFIEPHNDVSILYADVVNYTYLTTTLDVKTLVETLHDLFVKFDTASEEHNVLRIKFLGDCYYCVAGVPVPNEDHAKACVDLGLCMIRDIREVRQKRRLNIDMRIGVHSGDILSGVIGASKLQYDIWSKDVDIANRLEQTGMAGRVHVSERTLRLLDGEYLFEEGTPASRCDPVLKKYGIKSFLIKPPRSNAYLTRRNAGKNLKSQDSSTNFMHNTIYQYNQIRAQAKLEMSRELDKMPIGKIQGTSLCFNRTHGLTQDEMEEQTFRRNISSFCLFFNDRRWELQYLNQPDIMLKYSIAFAFFMFFGIFLIQTINATILRPVFYWSVIGSFYLILTVAVLMIWYRELWCLFYPTLDLNCPKNRISCWFFEATVKVQRNIYSRVAIYLVIMIVLAMTSFINVIDCSHNAYLSITDIDYDIDDPDSDLAQQVECFHPWSITSSLMLTIALGFLFTRIPFALKTTVGLIIILTYAGLVLDGFHTIYNESLPTNVGLEAEFSHLIVLFITYLIFLLMDFQTEFITKVDYNWKRQLLKKQYDAKVTNESINELINNILPAHVANIYIMKQMKYEMYYEEYDKVAVMFASIKNFDTEKVGLRVLNEIICDFDDVLDSYTGSSKIEKIKVAGWTYMAACGLDVNRSELRIDRSSSILPNGRRSHYLANEQTNQLNYNNSDDDLPARRSYSRASWQHYEGYKNSNQSLNSSNSDNVFEDNPNSNVVYVMTKFALDLMRTLQNFNKENLQVEDETNAEYGALRIGISHGRIMAGVVGSSKPHYDIWGNAVNMASRMDSTGIPGSIQVTQETAHILSNYNIQCTYRGMTNVKGRGEIPTYFVGIDKDFKFIMDTNSSIS